MLVLMVVLVVMVLSVLIVSCYHPPQITYHIILDHSPLITLPLFPGSSGGVRRVPMGLRREVHVLEQPIRLRPGGGRVGGDIPEE